MDNLSGDDWDNKVNVSEWQRCQSFLSLLAPCSTNSVMLRVSQDDAHMLSK